MVFLLIFPLDLKEFCLVYPILLWFFPQSFLKILLTFFLKGFWGSYIYIYISHLLIFPIGFLRSYSIDYKTTRRRKLIKEECYEEIRISDQFL